MSKYFQKYQGIIKRSILISLCILLITLLTIKGINKNSSNHQFALQAANLIQNNSDSSIKIPPHINLEDFYKTKGIRLLGNENLKIISREEWGVDISFSDPNFIKQYCQEHFCFSQPYDPEFKFTSTDYLKSRELIINYQTHFAKYDNLFLYSKQKENGVTYDYLPAEEIIIHHTAGKFTKTFEESKQELQRIYFLHAIQRKWGDIGYHYLIDGEGRIFEGNLGGKYSVGAHAYRHNRGTIGIALMGDFRPGHNKLTPIMIDSLIKLIQYLIKEYKWDVSQPLFYLRKPDLSGREWSNEIIKGHRELSATTQCPGIDPEELRKLIYPQIFSSFSSSSSSNRST